jgi:hypothetical protein
MMIATSKRQGKRFLGMTPSQLIILAILGILFCFLFSAFIGLTFYQNKPLPTHIPTVPSPTSMPATLTPTITQTPTPTITSTVTASSTPEPTFTPTEGVANPPDTTENIHVALIFNGRVDNPQDEIGVVDLVWGSKYPTQPEGVYNLYYYPFDRDRDGGTGGLHHDITWFLANHPDWIEYTCDRKTPAYEYGDPNVPLDITNPAVIDYMMQTYIIPAIEEGYQGIAFDNVDFNNNGYRCGVWRDGEWVGQSNYIDNILAWASSMYPRLHALYASVAMNFPYDVNNPAESDKIYQNLDIAVDERGFTNWGRSKDDYLSGISWLTNMQALQSLDALGKGFVSINEMPEVFDAVSQAEKQWTLANYLLVKGRYSYIAITGVQEYGIIFTTPEYSAAIGHALNAMYLSQDVYMRDYSNGLAIVNPASSQSFAITLVPDIYQDLYGNNVDTITLEPHSGIVLLRKNALSNLVFSPRRTSLIFPALQFILFP